jgi:single-strand DNA-binding protein
MFMSNGTCNLVFLTGHLTRDPNYHDSSNGRLAAFTGLATDNSYTDRNGQRHDQADFHDLTIFGKGAEFMRDKGVLKGTKVMITGQLRSRSEKFIKPGTNQEINVNSAYIEVMQWQFAERATQGQSQNQGYDSQGYDQGYDNQGHNGQDYGQRPGQQSQGTSRASQGNQSRQPARQQGYQQSQGQGRPHGQAPPPQGQPQVPNGYQHPRQGNRSSY